MNYHIMVQDKFLDSFIDDVYAIGEEKNNVFWFRGNQGDTSYIKTDKTVEYLGYDTKIYKTKLQTLKPTDSLFIHWYDEWIGEMVYNLPNKLFVFFWGGEMYEEPFWYHAKWIHDKLTYAIINKELYPKIIWRKNIFKMIPRVKKVLQFPVSVHQKFKHKMKFVERIDYLICNQLNTVEIEKVKKLYPTFKAIHLAGQYDINFDLAIRTPQKVKKTERIKILVGNSAAEANNHLDAFRKLKSLKNVEVYCPLSYGSEYYKKIVIEAGRSIFGKNFYPITDFMQRKEYVEFINEMDIVYMYHNRSQAWGNIATSLTLGKPVFLKVNNALKHFISAIGINTYDVNMIDQYDLESIIFQEKQISEDNNQKLRKSISKEVRLNNLKRIMTDYAV